MMRGLERESINMRNRNRKKKKTKDRIYGIGVFLTILGSSGIAQAITDSTTFITAAIIFSIGFTFVLYGYEGMWDPKHKDPYRNL